LTYWTIHMKNKRTVFFFVFDGLADWEASHALTGINKSRQFTIKTIAINKDPKRSMAGIKILPDLDFIPEVDLKDIDSTNTAMLILPGGAAWEDGGNSAIADLVLHCVQCQIPVAAICGATVFLADLQLLDAVDHTSNDLVYLRSVSSVYHGEHHYRNKASVHDQHIITANGTAAIEFAKDIFETLKIADNDEVFQWFQYFEKSLA